MGGRGRVSTDQDALPAGTTVYHCPLPACEWTFAQAPPGDAWPALPVITGESLDKAISRASMAVMARVLRQVRGSAGGPPGHAHDLEWVTEINRLRERLDKAGTAQWRTGSAALLLAAILLRRLGGEAFISDADQVSEDGVLCQMPDRDGFRISVSARP